MLGCFLYSMQADAALDDEDNFTPNYRNELIRAESRRGRGAVTNPEGRFENTRREEFDDGWESAGLEPPTPLQTVIREDRIRSIITRNNSPDIPFAQSINPYRGCEHGCIYCYARPSHAYMGLSPGLDFETRIFAKHKAADVLRIELSKKNYQPQVIALGANTDPYQPAERKLAITRSLLEVFRETRHPVGLISKSVLILRDLDILEDLAADNLVSVAVSITSLDPAFARKLEPRAATPARRVEVIEKLAERNIPVTLMAAPMIPGLNDFEMERILTAGARAGARSAAYVMMRLPYEVKDLFADWLQENYPDKKEHVLTLVRGMRGGRENDPRFGNRMRGTGVYANLMNKRFKVTAAKLGLTQGRFDLDLSRFKKPVRKGAQLNLFESAS